MAFATCPADGIPPRHLATDQRALLGDAVARQRSVGPTAARPAGPASLVASMGLGPLFAVEMGVGLEQHAVDPLHVGFALQRGLP
ncbi:MAG: hypothetical protein R2851_04645 [Caldilineaceae bacterium]